MDKAIKKGIKQEKGDLLRLCHTVPLEVVSLGGFMFISYPVPPLKPQVKTLDIFSLTGGKGYDPEKVDYSAFQAWLQCYYVDGMKSVRDHNGRTMWFKVSKLDN